MDGVEDCDVGCSGEESMVLRRSRLGGKDFTVGKGNEHLAGSIKRPQLLMSRLNGEKTARRTSRSAGNPALPVGHFQVRIASTKVNFTTLIPGRSAWLLVGAISPVSTMEACYR